MLYILSVRRRVEPSGSTRLTSDTSWNWGAICPPQLLLLERVAVGKLRATSVPPSPMPSRNRTFSARRGELAGLAHDLALACLQIGGDGVREFLRVIGREIHQLNRHGQLEREARARNTDDQR